MYASYPSLILGFHGCDLEIGESVLSGAVRLLPSRNEFDWLGDGIYFWENDPERALEFAKWRADNPIPSLPPINKPSVIGAVIHPGRCFNLLEHRALAMLKDGYDLLKSATSDVLPKNKPLKSGSDLILRDLDRAVIEYLHGVLEKKNTPPFDTVRAAFWEGSDLYPNAGFKEKNHIQICVRNPNCIKGYFRPITPDSKFSIP